MVEFDMLTSINTSLSSALSINPLSERSTSNIKAPALKTFMSIFAKQYSCYHKHDKKQTNLHLDQIEENSDEDKM